MFVLLEDMDSFKQCKRKFIDIMQVCYLHTRKAQYISYLNLQSISRFGLCLDIQVWMDVG